jgi:hypothetical protein
MQRPAFYKLASHTAYIPRYNCGLDCHQIKKTMITSVEPDEAALMGHTDSEFEHKPDTSHRMYRTTKKRGLPQKKARRVQDAGANKAANFCVLLAARAGQEEHHFVLVTHSTSGTPVTCALRTRLPTSANSARARAAYDGWALLAFVTTFCEEASERSGTSLHPPREYYLHKNAKCTYRCRKA